MQRSSVLLASAVLLVATPAAGDWLITLEGRLIETRGPWTIDGETLTYTDLEGEEHTLSLEEVDLEGSEETTALRAGETWEPRAEEEPDEAREARDGKADDEEPEVILYMTSLCPECTRARELLEELGVDFVAKDINISPMARREYRKKAGHGGGLPVLDIGGVLVFSNNPRVIRQRIQELRERECTKSPPEGGAAVFD